MTHTTEEFVRRELRSILRGDTYRNRFVCLPCLLSKDKPPTAPCAGVRWNALACARVRHNLGTNPAPFRPPQQNWGIVNPNSMNVIAGRLTPGQDLARPARAATLPMVDVIDMLGAPE